MLAAQVRLVHQEEIEERGEGDDQEPSEPFPYRRLREGVDGADNPTTREEGPEDGKPERSEDEPHVPDLQHAAFFLHHHGMQESGAGEPWHQRCIFDGVPSPVASPAEDGVGPMRPQENSAGEKSPGDHGPAAGDVDPFLAGILHDQRP